MLPLMIGTALFLGVGFAIYLHYQANEGNAYTHNRNNGSQSGYSERKMTTRPAQPIQRKMYKLELCPVCQESLEPASLPTTDLKCGHTYHSKCIADLITHQHKKCPYCESDIEIINN